MVSRPRGHPSTVRRILLTALAVLFLMAPAMHAQSDDPDVVRVVIDDVVSQGTTIHVQHALDVAEGLGVPLLIQLDTPGGLVQATLDMDDALARAEVPVLTYVGPGGGTFAASAGTFILLMGHQSGMAEGSTIGSAQPVSSDGGEVGDKTTNFLVERIRAIAERNGRDPDIAERFITENLNLDAGEALEAGLIDARGDDASAFLDAVHGNLVTVRGTSMNLDTQDAAIRDVDATLLASIVDVIGNPQVAFVLVLAGTYGVVFGITNAGSYVPEVLGALLLILGFIGLGLFSTSTAGIILLILALLFFVVEVFTPTHGILTGAGVVALIFAAIFLIQEPLLPQRFLQWFIGTGVALALTMGGLVFVAITLALRTAARPVHDALMGARGKVIDPLNPTGRIEVNGEVWYAETDIGPVQVGGRVTVLGREGLRLHVSPTTDEEE